MDWQSHLQRLSAHLLGNLDKEELEDVRDYRNITDYLGRIASKPEKIDNTEDRLGFKLPNSLRSFYLVSDGFTNADGFPVGSANILSVSEIFLLSDCQMRDLGIYADYVVQTFGGSYFSSPDNTLKNCAVIIDFDGNELGFVVRSDNMDDWPVVTYNPDGGDFELYSGFIQLMEGCM